jgi:hypothetical protein
MTGVGAIKEPHGRTRTPLTQAAEVATEGTSRAPFPARIVPHPASARNFLRQNGELRLLLRLVPKCVRFPLKINMLMPNWFRSALFSSELIASGALLKVNHLLEIGFVPRFFHFGSVAAQIKLRTNIT